MDIHELLQQSSPHGKNSNLLLISGMGQEFEPTLHLSSGSLALISSPAVPPDELILEVWFNMFS